MGTEVLAGRSLKDLATLSLPPIGLGELCIVLCCNAFCDGCNVLSSVLCCVLSCDEC